MISFEPTAPDYSSARAVVEQFLRDPPSHLRELARIPPGFVIVDGTSCRTARPRRVTLKVVRA